MFPSMPLTGGGRVPRRSCSASSPRSPTCGRRPTTRWPGVTGNPLVGNFYGRDVYDDDPATTGPSTGPRPTAATASRRSPTACGMAGGRASETALPNKQRAIALDYATNIAAGLRILQDKWNQTYDAGMIVNDGDPAKLENWFFALWAYNTRLQPRHTGATGGSRGASAGSTTRPTRTTRPTASRSWSTATTTPATRSQWPYPEKVHRLGGLPDLRRRRTATITATGRRGGLDEIRPRAAKPPLDQFCNATQRLRPGASTSRARPTWRASRWPVRAPERAGRVRPQVLVARAGDVEADCATTAATRSCASTPTYAEPAGRDALPAGLHDRPACRPGRSIVDDVADTVAVGPHRLRARLDQRRARSRCGFADRRRRQVPVEDRLPPDRRRASAGTSGSRTPADGRATVGGTDEGHRHLDARPDLDRWARVLVHMPDHGAHTQQAALRHRPGRRHVPKTRVHRCQRTRGEPRGSRSASFSSTAPRRCR